MKKKLAKLTSLILAAALMLTACGSSTQGNTSDKAGNEQGTQSVEQAAGEQKYKDTLVVGVDTEAVSADNHSDGDTASVILFNMVYDRLIYLDRVTGELQPMLAKSWEAVDEVTYTFNLRDDVKFSDGSQFTAEDVKWSYERQKDLVRNSTDVECIESIEIVDDYTVTFHLIEPTAPFLVRLSGSATGIQSKNSMASGEWTCIGTGPYTIEKWERGDSITFLRNENYWGGCPETERIVFRLIPETSARLIALENGEIDVCQKVAANDKDKVVNNEDLTLFEGPSSGVEYVVFNCAKAPFDNVKVRQALNAATNRAELVQGVLKGEGKICNTPVGFGVTYHSDEIEGFDNDPELAKQLLAEAGYADGFSFSMLVKGSQQQLTAQILQAQFKEIGVEMDIQFAENTAFFDALNRGDFDAGMITRGCSTGDPADQLDYLFGENLGTAGNRGSWINEEFDTLYKASMSETDFDKRGELFVEMQQIVATECPWICMMCANLYTGAVRGLEGYVQQPTNSAVYRDIYLPIN